MTHQQDQSGHAARLSRYPVHHNQNAHYRAVRLRNCPSRYSQRPGLISNRSILCLPPCAVTNLLTCIFSRQYPQQRLIQERYTHELPSNIPIHINPHRPLYLCPTAPGSTREMYDRPRRVRIIVFRIGYMKTELNESKRLSEVRILEDFSSIRAAGSLPCSVGFRLVEWVRVYTSTHKVVEYYESV